MKKYLYTLRYIFSVHLTGLLFLTMFRLILFLRGATNLEHVSDPGLQLTAFIRGVWFDNVVACYVMIAPLTVLSIAALFGYFSPRVYRGTNIYFGILYTALFLISASDIPYFEYFFKHLNASIFNWMDYGDTTLKMMLGEPAYRWPIFFFVVATVTFCFLLNWYQKLAVSAFKRMMITTESLRESACVFGLLALLIWACLFGIRGRMGYNPIRVSAAYYCPNIFLNQLGINPAFNLMRSSLETMKEENKSLNLLNGEEAIANVRRYMSITDSLPDISPIARKIKPAGVPVHKNVVLVFMESMSGKLMQRFGDTRGLTPFLDSLANVSTTFDRFYSSGTHTNHGMYSTLYGYPAMMKRNLMKGANIPYYTGLPCTLQENGYRTLFFMTHESQYDNMNGFFRSNGYNEIYSQEDYPEEKVVNSFGVQDDYLYEYAIPVLNAHAKEGQPFFATLLSISNHPPYIIPPYFKPRSNNIEEQIVEYADWAMRQLMEEAKRQPWYNNTLFVFLADHGKLVGSTRSDMPLSYHHIPLIFFEPGKKGCTIDALGGQMDVGPTILGMLNLPYTNNTLGIDLFKESRPCMLFTSDDAIGCIDREHFYIYSPGEEQEWLLKLKEGEEANSYNDPVKKNELKAYAFSVLQTAQEIINREETGKYKGYTAKQN